jgi:hypothetical protein
MSLSDLSHDQTTRLRLSRDSAHEGAEAAAIRLVLATGHPGRASCSRVFETTTQMAAAHTRLPVASPTSD